MKKELLTKLQQITVLLLSGHHCSPGKSWHLFWYQSFSRHYQRILSLGIDFPIHALEIALVQSVGPRRMNFPRQCMDLIFISFPIERLTWREQRWRKGWWLILGIPASAFLWVRGGEITITSCTRAVGSAWLNLTRRDPNNLPETGRLLWSWEPFQRLKIDPSSS